MGARAACSPHSRCPSIGVVGGRILALLIAAVLAGCDVTADDDGSEPPGTDVSRPPDTDDIAEPPDIDDTGDEDVPEHPGRIEDLHELAEDCVDDDAGACDELGLRVTDTRATDYIDLASTCGHRLVTPRPGQCDALWGTYSPDDPDDPPLTGWRTLDELARACAGGDLGTCTALVAEATAATVPASYAAYASTCGGRLAQLPTADRCDDAYDGREAGSSGPAPTAGLDANLDALAAGCSSDSELGQCDLLARDASNWGPDADDHLEFGETCGDRNRPTDDCEQLHGGANPRPAQPPPGLAITPADEAAADCHAGDAERCDAILERLEEAEEWRADYIDWATSCGGRVVNPGEYCSNIFGTSPPPQPPDITDIGRDDHLDKLLRRCAESDLAACSQLLTESPAGSGYARFAEDERSASPTTVEPATTVTATAPPPPATSIPSQVVVDEVSSTPPATTVPPAPPPAPPTELTTTSTFPEPSPEVAPDPGSTSTTSPVTTMAAPTTTVSTTAATTTTVLTDPQQIPGRLACELVDQAQELLETPLDLTINDGYVMRFPNSAQLSDLGESIGSGPQCDIILDLRASSTLVDIQRDEVEFGEAGAVWAWNVTAGREFTDEPLTLWITRGNAAPVTARAMMSAAEEDPGPVERWWLLFLGACGVFGVIAGATGHLAKAWTWLFRRGR